MTETKDLESFHKCYLEEKFLLDQKPKEASELNRDTPISETMHGKV